MKNNIQENIIESIKSGKIHMKPRWYFVLKFILNFLIFGIVFFATIYFLSFIGLVVHEKELFNLFDLSPKGLRMFLSSIPWIVVMFSVILFMVLYVLVKDYSFVYKKPLAYSFFGLVIFVLLIGFVVHIFDVNFRFAKIGEDRRPPIIGPMHKYYRGDMKDRDKIDRIEKRIDKKQKNIRN